MLDGSFYFLGLYILSYSNWHYLSSLEWNVMTN